MPRELANVNGTEATDMLESDSMDVDFVDDARHAITHNNPTSNVPRAAVAGTASVAAATHIPGFAVVSRNLRNPAPQTNITKSSLKRSITPKPTDQPVVIYLDESPLKTRLARQSIAQRTATSVSEDIVRYMCDTKYCALTSLLVERLEQNNTILKSLGSITTGFDPPPWRTSTVLFTVILYHWDVLKQVLPRGIETNIRQSLPWIMYVEELQSCPQLKRPLPPNLRIAPYARTSHSSQTSEDPDLVSETKLLIQLAKRLLAQCALVENDVQERQRQKLVSSWVTWQNSKD
ncbi:hypothetical protein EV177_001855 [Coemansia sp. RSA 1804]|nr:hypothetical protein EV177_001855 [Coemansia sp. RSA 1804]